MTYLTPLALLLLSQAHAETVHRLKAGGRDLLRLTSSHPSISADACPDTVAEVYLSADGRSIEVEAIRSGTCELAVDGRLHVYHVYDPGSDGQALCDEARDLVRGSPLSIRCQGRFVEIGGFTPDSFLRYRVENFARERDGIFLRIEEMLPAEVEYTITFLETRSQRYHDVGIGWPDALPAALSGVASTLASGGAVGWEHAIPVLEQVSAESIVANFEVFESWDGRTAVGEHTEMRWGGIHYEQISGVQTADIREIPYGLRAKLRFEPHAGGYLAEVDAELSGDVPGENDDSFDQAYRSTVRTVPIRMGETVVIAHGVSNRSWVQERGLPLLSHIPGLGMLFGRHKSQEAPVYGAVLLTLCEPGDHPYWLERLAELDATFGVEQ